MFITNKTVREFDYIVFLIYNYNRLDLYSIKFLEDTWMPREGVTIYDLLISCPGDVTSYLQLIKEAVDNFNKLYGSLNNIQVSIKHWSTDSFPESGDKPQELLNKQIVRECDAAVAIFWTRFGTVTDNYESGTEEEIEEMLSADKQVFMYFLEAPIIPSNIDIKQYEKVQEFKERYKDRGIFFIVKDEIDFQRLFTNHLSLYFLKLISEKETFQNEQLKPLLTIRDKNTSSDECSVPIKFNLLESKFLNENYKKIIDHIEELNKTVISEVPTKVDNNTKKLTLSLNEEDNVNFLSKIADDVTISDDFKKLINDFAIKEEIKLHEKFWCLGNLKKNKLQMATPFGKSATSYIGTDEERNRFSLLKKLYWEIVSFNEYTEYFTFMDNIEYIELMVSNIGKSYDEDIDIKLIVPKGCLLKHDDLLYPGENIIEKVQEIKIEEILFEISETDSVCAYDYPQQPSFRSEEINVSPLLTYTRTFSYEDQKEYYKDSLNDIFIYRYFDKPESDILRFDIEYLKHNTSMAFPSKLLFKNVPSTIEYEITSKFTPDMVKGKINLKSE